MKYLPLIILFLILACTREDGERQDSTTRTTAADTTQHESTTISIDADTTWLGDTTVNFAPKK